MRAVRVLVRRLKDSLRLHDTQVAGSFTIGDSRAPQILIPRALKKEGDMLPAKV
ncbi:MAG: hypothetical protein ABSB82_03475 [Terriglobia bacterium]